MSYPKVGSASQNNSCSFAVWAPSKTKVEVVLENTGSRHLLSRNESGYWTANVSGAQPGMEYWFLLDDEKKLPDPASRAQLKGVHGPSTVVDESFRWTDNHWRGLPLREMIIYELHTGTFSAAGNFEGIISKLSYFKKLGVNTIEIMPVAQFPGARNWGYDGVFPFAVQDSYGGVDGLKKLVNAAHLEGIAVVLDVVYNHMGPEGNYLSEFGPYFTDKYKTGWGAAINFDGPWCDGVRHYFWQNALMWLDDFHLDGLRLDAVHAIWDFGARHFIEELVTKVRALEENSGRKKVLIAEFDLNNPRYITPQEKGGYGMHGQWIDEFHHALHSLVTGEKEGYYEDFGETEQLGKSLTDGYVYTGQFSKHRKKHFGREPHGTTYDQFVVFAQNHDQIGNRMLGERLPSIVSKEMLKLAAAAYLLSPFVPMLFMGEEYGETNPFQYFISHTDKKLIELVRKGRREEFSYFDWQGDVPDPQSERTFHECLLSWKVENDREAQVLFSFYQFLIQFRKNRPAMQGRTRDTINVLTSENGLVSFERKFKNDYVLIILNFNKERLCYTPPRPLSLKQVFDSSSSQWGGTGITEVHPSKNESIVLNPESALIFESQ